jgi:hypothetical protein
MKPPSSLRIFLCHASSDKPAVRDLYRKLVADGFDAWLDEENLLPGQSWHEVIEAEVVKCDIVIVCLSNQSITKSGFVQKEIRYALDAAYEKPEGTIYIIPARLEECPVPRLLSEWQWVNLYEPGGYGKLKASLMRRAETMGPGSTAPTMVSEKIEQPLVGIQQLPSLDTSEIITTESHETGRGKRSLSILSPGIIASVILAVILMMAGINQWLQFSAKKFPGDVPTARTPAVNSSKEPFRTSLPATGAGSTELAPTLAATLQALTPQDPFSVDQQTQSATDAALVTFRNGDSVEIASNWILYSGGGSRYGDLLTGLKLQNRGDISFSDIKSMDFGETPTNDHSVTLELLGGEKIEDKLDSTYAYGSMIGVMNEGEFKATFDEIERMDFKQTPGRPILIEMATVVNSAGEEIQAPADLLEASFVGVSMAGPYTYTRDGWTFENGMLVPFKLMKGFEFDENTSSSGPTIVYTLLDGRTLTDRIDTSDNPTLRGITDLGTFHLNHAAVRRVDFHRNDSRALPLMSTLQATLTLQNGVVYKIPAYWLAFKSPIWKNYFSLVGYSNIFFNEVKSLKIQAGDDVSTVMSSIDLLDNHVIQGKMRLGGYDELVGIDTQGNFIKVSLQEVKQIIFEQGFTPPTGISVAIITRSDGTEIQAPLNSVKILIGSSSWGYYSYSYTDEIGLTTGIKVPLSKIKKFDVGPYDSEVSLYPVTIHLIDGKVINSYFENSLNNTFAIAGFTDAGPFDVDVKQIQTVNFNR